MYLDYRLIDVLIADDPDTEVRQESEQIRQEIRPSGQEISPTGQEFRPTGQEIRKSGHEVRPKGQEIMETVQEQAPRQGKQVAFTNKQEEQEAMHSRAQSLDIGKDTRKDIGKEPQNIRKETQPVRNERLETQKETSANILKTPSRWLEPPPLDQERLVWEAMASKEAKKSKVAKATKETKETKEASDVESGFFNEVAGNNHLFRES